MDGRQDMSASAGPQLLIIGYKSCASIRRRRHRIRDALAIVAPDPTSTHVSIRFQ